MFYQTSFKRSRGFWVLIGARKLLCFSAQLEGSIPWSRFVCSYLIQHNNGHSMRWNSFCWGMQLCKWWQEVFYWRERRRGIRNFWNRFKWLFERVFRARGYFVIRKGIVPGRRPKKSTKKQTTKKPRGKQTADKRGKVRGKKNKFLTGLMIGSSKNKRENYPRKCFWTEEKETRVKFNPGLSANRPSNNWALDEFADK